MYSFTQDLTLVLAAHYTAGCARRCPPFLGSRLSWLFPGLTNASIHASSHKHLLSARHPASPSGWILIQTGMSCQEWRMLDPGPHQPWKKRSRVGQGSGHEVRIQKPGNLGLRPGSITLIKQASLYKRIDLRCFKSFLRKNEMMMFLRAAGKTK